MQLQAVADSGARDALLAGNLGGRSAAPGWPHDDTVPGLSFVNAGGFSFLVIDDDGRIAGECGTKAPPTANGVVEIGYGLAAPSRGRGLGGAAVTELVRWLGAREDIRRIEAEVHVGNLPSQRVIARLGFLPTGHDVGGYRRYALEVDA